MTDAFLVAVLSATVVSKHRFLKKKTFDFIMDSLNQTALMNLENRIIPDEELIDWGALMSPVDIFMFTIFTMPIVVLLNYSNTILGFFELAASVSRKYIVAKNLTPLQILLDFILNVPHFAILYWNIVEIKVCKKNPNSILCKDLLNIS